MREDDRVDTSKAVRRRIDTGDYVIFVSKTENRVSTIREGRGEWDLTNRKLEAHGTLDAMTLDGSRFLLLCWL